MRLAAYGALFVVLLVQMLAGALIAWPTPGELGDLDEVPCRAFFESPRDVEVRLVGCAIRTRGGRVELEPGFDRTEWVRWVEPDADLVREAEMIASLEPAERSQWWAQHPAQTPAGTRTRHIETRVEGTNGWFDDSPILLKPVGPSPGTRRFGVALSILAVPWLLLAARSLRRWRSAMGSNARRPLTF